MVIKGALPLIVICFAGGGFLLNAQTTWDQLEYPELNPFERPEVEVFELDNGVRLYLLEDDELPLIDLQVRVRTGSYLVPNEKAGLNRVMGEVLRSGGTGTVSPDSLEQLLEDRAARLSTSIGFTSGEISLNTLNEDFEELLPLVIDLILDPAYPDDRISLAKRQLETSISRRNDQQSDVANREFRRLIYGPDSVYGRLMEYETLSNVQRDDLIEFHESSSTGSNLMVGVTGDFDSDEMRALLEEYFSGIPAGEKREIELPEVDYEFEHSIHFVDKRDVNQSHILIGHIGGKRDNPDYAKLQMMNRVLSGGFSGRLFRIVRSELGLAYAVFGSYGSQMFYPGMFTTGVLTRSEATADAIEAVLEQVKRLQEEPVSEEELEQTRDRFLNSLVFEYETRASVLNERMRYDYAGMDPDSFDQLVEEIRNVTVEDIHEVAREYLRPDAVRILVVGNGAELGDQLEQFGDIDEIDITISSPEERPEPGLSIPVE